MKTQPAPVTPLDTHRPADLAQALQALEDAAEALVTAVHAHPRPVAIELTVLTERAAAIAVSAAHHRRTHTWEEDLT